MGIDIYSKWKNQSENDESQITGFSVTAGDVGYLREAYHGSPYVTKNSVAVAFQSKTAEAQISVKVLKERLPVAVLMSLYREKKVYSKEGVGEIHIDKEPKGLMDALKNVFEVEMKDESHKTFADSLTKHHLEYAKARIDNKDLPDYAQSFVDFVNFMELKEQENGEPCTIIASY